MDIGSVVDNTLKELHGRIFRDFNRLTNGNLRPANDILIRLEELFQRVTELLREDIRQSAAIAPHRQDIDHAFTASPLDGVQSHSTTDHYEHGGTPGLSTVTPRYATGTSHSPTEFCILGENAMLEASIEKIYAPTQRKRSTAPNRSNEVKLMDQAMTIDARAVTVRDKLLESLAHNSTQLPMLTLLSVGFACPRAVSQLIQLVPAMCGCTHLWIPGFPTSTSSLMASIDQIESDSQANIILRRFYLAQLRQSYYRNVSNLANTSGRLGKASSTTIEAMTDDFMTASRCNVEAERDSCRTRLKNRLCFGRLWCQIYSKYSYGGLALFSTELPTSTYMRPSTR